VNDSIAFPEAANAASPSAQRLSGIDRKNATMADFEAPDAGISAQRAEVRTDSPRSSNLPESACDTGSHRRPNPADFRTFTVLI